MSAEKYYGQHNGIDRFNPPKRPEGDDDWWDKLCKQHGAKNLWKKKEAKKTEVKKVKKLKNKKNKNSK